MIRVREGRCSAAMATLAVSVSVRKCCLTINAGRQRPPPPAMPSWSRERSKSGAKSKSSWLLGRNSKVKRTLILLLMLMPSVGHTTSVMVGNTPIEIPTPVGFAVVTRDMKTAYDYVQLRVPDSNTLLLAFIPESDIPDAMNDQLPMMQRSLTVQISKSFVNMAFSEATFAELKREMRRQNEQLSETFAKELPGFLEHYNRETVRKWGLDGDFSLSQSVPLAPHVDTLNTFAFSSYIKFGTTNDLGLPATVIRSGTATIVLVKKKVLFLYVNGAEVDLDWSRQMARDWASAVFARNLVENGSGPSVARSALTSSDVWRGRILAALKGALRGGAPWAILCLIMWALMRILNRRRSDS